MATNFVRQIFSRSGESSHVRVFTLSWLLFCGLLAFLIRSIPYRNFLGTSGEYLFYGPDSYDHLRRITLGISQFPKVPVFDSYYGFPAGTGQIWSPLFDYILTIISLAADFGKGDARTVHFIGFWLSPILSFFTVIMVYAACKRFFNRSAGLAAAFIIAVIPGHILYSFVSELDHHVAEPMVSLAIFIYLLKEMESIRDWPERKRLLPATALWLVIALLFWRGSVIFWGVVLLSLIIHIFLDAERGERAKAAVLYAKQVTFSAAILLIPASIFNAWQLSNGMNFNIISWFHVTFMFFFALFFSLYDLILKRKAVSIPIVLAVLTVLVISFLSFPSGRRFFVEFLSGLAVIGGNDPWLSSISELRPMLFPQGSLDIFHPTETLTVLYWLFPAILIINFVSWRKNNYRDFRPCLFLIFSTTFWLLPLFRERYVHLASVAVAIGGGGVFSMVSYYFSGIGRRIIATCVVGGILFMLLTPSIPFFINIPRLGLTDYERNDFPAALKWLREKTPQTSYFNNPIHVPEYGVISDWGVGAYINYVAQRPTVATNFGWETHGLFESAAFLTLTEPEVAERILEKNRVRYLLLNGMGINLPSLREILEFGLNKGKYTLPFPLSPFAPEETMYYRLYFQDGSSYDIPRKKLGALGGYRLLYESPNGFVSPMAGFVSYYKIFEHVPGAAIKGKTKPWKEITLQLRLKSPTGRVYIYRNTIIADEMGDFEFRVPYATDKGIGDVVALGQYEIELDGKIYNVDVNEEDIQSGKALRI